VSAGFGREGLPALKRIWNRHGRVFGLHLDLTWGCPLRCVHCCLPRHRDGSGELPAGAWVRVLDEAARMGVFQVTLSGGDPMARRDFWTVLEAARERLFLVILKTTGLRVTSAVAARIARMRHVIVDVSLHGGPEEHDRIVGMPGAHRRTVAAVRLLRAAGVRTRVMALAVAVNMADVERVVAACAAMDVECRATTGVWPVVDGTGLSHLAASQEDRARFERQTWAPRLEGPLPAIDPAGPLCGAARGTLYVSPRGVVQPCASWPVPLGDVRRDGLEAAWRGAAAEAVRRLATADRRACTGCALLAMCPFCPGASQATAGDPTAPNRTSCSQADVVRRIRDGEVPR